MIKDDEKMMLKRCVIDAIKEHAASAYPLEACGFVIDGEYVKVKNIAEHPMEDFLMPPDSWPLDKNVECVIHSHTANNPAPSQQDMASQLATNVPWGIVVADAKGNVTDPYFWGCGVAELDYIGRIWRHGPTGTDNGGDCYALLRDYYKREYGVELNEYPREFDWVRMGDDFFAKNFENEGFERISENELQPGDCFLMAINSDGVPNHCGVYLGNGLGLHHLINRLSRTEPLHGWRKFITHYLRYNKKSEGE